MPSYLTLGEIMAQAVSAVRQRETVGGWLLVICVLLVPHILNSALILANSAPFIREAVADRDVGVETLRLVTLAVMFLGHSSGLLLIVSRHRFTPAYFTLYVPLLLVLFFVDPDPGATARSYAERLGLAYPEGAGTFIVQLTVSLAASALFFGYWLRSERVRRTFGSNGLETFRQRSANP